RKKIVKYPEVLILFTDRETDNEYDFKKYPVDFEEKMTLDRNNYHLAGVTYHSGIHFWSHVKSIDDGQWYEANDRKITKIGKEIMPFVRGEKAIKGGTRGQEDLRSAAIIWMYVKEEKDS
ncbi:MAG: ubiquitin carboxyl-terminal hydrolase family protein, partial [Bacteroidota bacterium]